MKKALGIFSIILVLCLAMTSISFATNAEKKENITYRSIKIVVDGKTISPVDVTGASTEPFILNSDGSTYLPVRAVAGALGLDVDWNEEASKVILKSGGSVVNGAAAPSATNKTVNASLFYRDITITLDGVKVSLVNAKGEAVEPFIYNNSTFIPLRAVASALGADVSWDDATSTVTITTKEPLPASNLTVSTNPIDVKVIESDSATATFKVAVKDGVTPYSYQWQYSADKGETWANTNISSSRTAELTLTSIKADMNGYLYRCVITDAAKSVTSGCATLTVDPKLSIKTQPASITKAIDGELASFTVVADGGKAPYTYLWTQSNDGGKTWISCTDAKTTLGVSSATDATLYIDIDEKKDGHCYKCTVKDADGAEVVSDAAKYNYVQLLYDLYISHDGLIGSVTYAAIVNEIAKSSSDDYSVWDLTKLIASNATIKFTAVPKDAADEYVTRLEAARATVTKVLTGEPVVEKTYSIIFNDLGSKLVKYAVIPAIQVVSGMSFSEAKAFYENGLGQIEGIPENKIDNYITILKLAGADVEKYPEN